MTSITTLMPGSLRQMARASTLRLLDIVLPPRCLACGDMVDAVGRLCTPCWSQLPLIAGTCCRACARPLEDSASSSPLCEPCATEPPAWDRAVAALRYEGLARRLILRFKHGDRTEASALMATWMATAARSIAGPETLVLPVPLHRWRLLARGYNQAALLAQNLARELSADYAPHLLQRARATVSQQGLDAAARQRNITAQAFAIPRPDRVAGRSVLLVDDVLTTGATLNACAMVLHAAGAARVDVAVLARVARDDTPPI